MGDYPFDQRALREIHHIPDPQPVTKLRPVKDGGNAVRAGESQQSGSLISTPPVADAPAIDVRAVEPQQPGSISSGLTLYHLADDLVSLLALREDMAENKEGTEAVDAAIAEYMQALPQKVDAVAHVLTTLDSQAELAAAEVARLAARRRRIASAAERLRAYVGDVLGQLPKPSKGCRKLEGSTATLMLKGNGGLEPLEIYDESLVPDECCTATVTMPYSSWKALYELWVDECAGSTSPLADSVKREPSNTAVRKALAERCWLCMGNSADCTACGGSGKNGVPGARLLERGAHVEIK